LSQLNCQLQALISIPDRELREEMPENYFKQSALQFPAGARSLDCYSRPKVTENRFTVSSSLLVMLDFLPRAVCSASSLQFSILFKTCEKWAYSR
jgi:hypothetical protein